MVIFVFRVIYSFAIPNSMFRRIKWKQENLVTMVCDWHGDQNLKEWQIAEVVIPQKGLFFFFSKSYPVEFFLNKLLFTFTVSHQISVVCVLEVNGCVECIYWIALKADLYWKLWNLYCLQAKLIKTMLHGQKLHRVPLRYRPVAPSDVGSSDSVCFCTAAFTILQLLQVDES